MASVTANPAPVVAPTPPPSVSFNHKKSATPSGKRKIATVSVSAAAAMIDLENVENQRQSQQQPKMLKAGSSPLPPINSSTQLIVTTGSNKKTFTGTSVNVTALTNKANIINNNQQPKATKVTQKVQLPSSAVQQTAPKSVSITQVVGASPEVQPSLSKGVKAVLPQAVARRNARERNRVKQVNNGFAALRQHIPEEMAEAFENYKGSTATMTTGSNNGMIGTPNNASAATKKLSKVETLRMAVEYIRNLESLLNLSSSNCGSSAASAAVAAAQEHSFSFCDTSSLVSHSPSSPSCSNSSMIDEESSLHPPQKSLLHSAGIHSQFLSFDESSSIDQSHVVLPSVTTINGIPYLRLPNHHHHHHQIQNQLLGQDFLDQSQGDFIVVTTTATTGSQSDHSDFYSGDDEENQQSQFMYQPGVDHHHHQSQQPIILYAAAAPTSSSSESNFQSNFVNNNLLAPAAAYQGVPTTVVVDERRHQRGSGGGSVGGQSPVPDGDQIKIEPSRGFNNIAAYVNKSPLIRHQQQQLGQFESSRDTPASQKRLIGHVVVGGEEESPPQRLCTGNEQFSVVDQSGVIIRGNFIEIKQEQPQQQQQQQSQFAQSPSAGSDEFLATAESMYDNVHDDHHRLLNMKTEIREVDEETDLSLLETTDITEEHMIDAMEWWENEKKSA